MMQKLVKAQPIFETRKYYPETGRIQFVKHPRTGEWFRRHKVKDEGLQSYLMRRGIPSSYAMKWLPWAPISDFYRGDVLAYHIENLNWYLTRNLNVYGLRKVVDKYTYLPFSPAIEDEEPDPLLSDLVGPWGKPEPRLSE